MGLIVRDGAGSHTVLDSVTCWSDLKPLVRTSVVEGFTVCCDFIWEDADKAAVDLLMKRLQAGAAPPGGLVYAIESISAGDPASPGARIRLTLKSVQVPVELRQLSGWHGFKFESLRKLFQFRRNGASLADEQLHERLRHCLRSISRKFAD